DMIVGAPNYDHGETDEGSAFLWLGGSGAFPGSTPWLGEGNKHDTHYGRAVAAAGDVDGDGFDDFLAGAPDFSNGQNWEGKAYLYRGAATAAGFVLAWKKES